MNHQYLGERSNHRLGLTLIEVLVSIAILAILAGLMLGGLRSARERAQMTICMSHIRSMGNMVQNYASDNRDLFPSWISSGINYNAEPEHWRSYAYQIFGTFESVRWREYADISTNTEMMYCPANQWYPEWFEDVAAPDYVISASAFISPTYLSPDIEFSNYSQSLGGQVQRLSSARYPSAKAGLFELSVWHGWRSSFEPDQPVGDLAYWQSRLPGSVWFIDGHVDQIYQREGTRPVNRYPIWSPMTFGTTANGILGRDID